MRNHNQHDVGIKFKRLFNHFRGLIPRFALRVNENNLAVLVRDGINARVERKVKTEDFTSLERPSFGRACPYGLSAASFVAK